MHITRQLEVILSWMQIVATPNSIPVVIIVVMYMYIYADVYVIFLRIRQNREMRLWPCLVAELVKRLSNEYHHRRKLHSSLMNSSPFHEIITTYIFFLFSW